MRIQVAVSQWQLVPLEQGGVEVTFSGYGEPGGSISSATYRSALFQWLVKQFLWEVPYKTLLGLIQYTKQQRYQNQRFEFIVEPADG